QAQFPEKTVDAWFTPLKGQDNLTKLAAKTKSSGYDFVVVGPDNVLADGAVEIFEREGIKIFGPTSAAAKLESSKLFAKQVMKSARVPTAEFYEANSAEAAVQLLKDLNWTKRQWVIKADGLALGKGVEVCENLTEALRGLERLKQYSNCFVIEERLFGRELSWLAFCDGDSCSLFPPAQDYKTLTEDPLSPNTGGMGSIAPVPVGDNSMSAKVREQVFMPMLQEMKKRGTPYKGILYAGLMLGQEDFWVLEFNARFGDPETQALMPIMSGDLLEWCEASVNGTLHAMPKVVPSNNKKSVFVVAASAGYPDAPRVNDIIENLQPWITEHRGFFAGISYDQERRWLTSGGRVLGALGIADTFGEAREIAFGRLDEIDFEGMQVRNGVGAEWV
ncbi:MAG: phosphoribosylamine--glycine ligase, partial [Bdellovibrionaceae bacterium]|nr:phosphoribosylamine--glycine ligase [Pseudobdellovibrionaceae bacterium]